MARSASDTLRDIGHGQCIDELGEKLRELTLACDETGKGGKLSLTISIKPAGRQSGAMQVSYESKLSKPMGEKPSTIMFGTPEGDLLADNPRQSKLDLRDVSNTPASLKTIQAA